MTTPPHSTTRRDLLRFGAALVVLTVLVAAFALAAFDRTQRAADTVRSDTAPAVVELALARAALVEADRAAMTSFSSGAVRLAGPGDAYRDQIAIASQHLTRAAAHDVGDSAGPRTLELVNALLAAYTSSVEQAAASFQHSEATPLWVGDLWTASRLLHSEGGVLAQLDGLRDAQIGKLDAEVGGANTVLSALSWLVPGLALLVLLGVVQIVLRRRFRRTLNAGLVVATACVLGMLVVTALTLAAGSRLGATRDTVHELRDAWHQQVSARDLRGQQTLADMIGARCSAEAGECGSTVQRVDAAVRSGEAVDAPQQDLTLGSARIDEHAAAASAYGGWRVAIPLAALAALAGIVVGIAMRTAEYRYRAR